MVQVLLSDLRSLISVERTVYVEKTKSMKTEDKNERKARIKELVQKAKSGASPVDFEGLIADLKKIKTSPFLAAHILESEFDMDYENARKMVLDSKTWEGVREVSERFTQAFLDVAAKTADEVTRREDGRVNSVMFDLTKDDNSKDEK